MFWYRYGTGPSKESCFKPTKIGQGNFNDILIDVTKGNVVRVDSNSWKSAGNRFAPKKLAFSTGKISQRMCGTSGTLYIVGTTTKLNFCKNWSTINSSTSSAGLSRRRRTPRKSLLDIPAVSGKKKKQDTQPSDHPLETLHMIQSGTSPLPDLKMFIFHPYYQKICCIVSIITIQSPQKKCVK